MIKILIVDDERRICRLINRLVDYSGLGLTLAGFAYDGLTALEMIKEEKPQIVVTDIKMPEMDGLELIKAVRDLGMDTRFIILSGYGTFDYARSAIRYQVDDYLLKPVNGPILNETLEKLCGIIAAQGGQGAETQETIAQRTSSYFISSLIYNPKELEGKSIPTLNAEYGLHFETGLFRVLILNLLPCEKEARITAIVRQVDQLFGLAMEPKCCLYRSMIDKERIVIVLNYQHALAERMDGMLEYAFNGLTMNQEISSFVRMTLLMGTVADSPAGLYDSFCSAERSMNLGILKGYNACYRAARGGVHNLVLSEEERKRFIAIIEAGEKEEMARLLREMSLRRMPAMLENPAELFSLVNTLGAFADWAAMQGMTSDRFAEIRSRVAHQYRACTTLEELEELVLDGMWEMREIYEEIRAGKQSMPVVVAKQYIQQNFKKPLSLEEVAGEVYLSPSYFSSMFRKEEGMTFSDYLVQLRVHEAKHLLSDPHLSVAEVAAEVGYPDQRYFSRVFKKATGINPLEFRRLQSFGLPKGRP